MKRVSTNEHNCCTADESLPKKLKENLNPFFDVDLLMAESSGPAGTTPQDTLNNLRSFVQHGMDVEHTSVERTPNPCDYLLLNPKYVGFMTDTGGSLELNGATTTATTFLATNSVTRIDEIGRQMKFLHESLQDTIRRTERSAILHKAACNFVKIPGHVYHLYSRPSGQKYFSMLSPEEWSGNPPHRFLGSWYLGLDQSWTPLEEMNNRNEGVAWLQSISSNFPQLM